MNYKLKPIIFVVISLFILSCTTTKPKPSHPERAPAPIVFPPSYNGKIPAAEPKTWPEFYNAGTYLFNHGKYKLACDHFLKAADLTKGEPRKISLTAAALSALGANDPRFLSIREKITSEEKNNPFTNKTLTDRAIEHLLEITRDYKEEGE